MTDRNAWLVVLSGGSTGTRLELDTDRIEIGRGPEAGLRFDPERDLEVSSRHALIARRGDTWSVRDLQSRNGTFVNGVRILDDTDLSHGDRIRFGPNGPEVAFETGAAPPTFDSGVHRELARRTRPWRYLALALTVLLVGVVAWALESRRSDRAEWAAARAGLLATVDSLLAEGARSIGSMESELDGLRTALGESESRVRTLRDRVEEAASSPSAGPADSLRAALQQAAALLRSQQLAAAIDYQGIERAHMPSTARIWVEDDDGTVRSGTAFVAGSPKRLLTNAHLFGPAGGRRRVAVQLSGGSATHRARLLAASSVVDLAAVELEAEPGNAPPLPLNERPDTLATGRPVVLIGYPFGGTVSVGAERRARPLTSVGILVRIGPGELTIQGYGAEGASGSPVFDENGEVIGVLRGGVVGGGGQMLVAVSSEAAIPLLAVTGRESQP